ncbi:hypothetical protein PF010_g2106 [Phytophthora fragariae]|uniref:Uncharacterized protein n=1 Tax=Phytophthora fragariae TaxID=53985 RepID=A0A6A3TEH1_9STRA|nr:hypothetical protein PF003_g25002 [Phytophthora fragariae]KAE8947719.1 hypothetical protein PF009_g2670 [Phytophthora fragariae]KAE9135345.1 hypothetical protein PF010_g2106 [Phytophthora fragariae]KAE9135496.1 hypothetical protein PF007_g2530 [Phytophthora fragariae]KAE9154438.1 hypothetical protein PF006_g1505 [Phytophthora fragariae]
MDSACLNGLSNFSGLLRQKPRASVAPPLYAATSDGTEATSRKVRLGLAQWVQAASTMAKGITRPCSRVTTGNGTMLLPTGGGN